MKISFIGGGVMAEAIIAGVLKARLAAPGEIRVGEPVEARRSYLEQKYGLEVLPRNIDAADGTDMVVLSVKPQNLPEVLLDLRAGLKQEHTVLSIVAGASLATLTKGLGHSSVIRVMPNTPARIGAGMSVWTANPDVATDKIGATRDILRTLGEELFVPEEKFVDMATALSASGPAYVFLFLEALIDSGVYLGMSREMARKLAVQTVLGSARLVDQSGRHPAELRDMVTSPGGTTAEALLALERGGFRGVVQEAVVAAYKKSVQLGKQS